MELMIEGLTENAQKEINALVEHLAVEFGCDCILNKEFPSISEYVTIDVTLAPNRKIYIPDTTKIKVFRIDTEKQIMTIIFFPD